MQIQKPTQVQKDYFQRKPKFPDKLFDERFVDPKQEFEQVLLPSQFDTIEITANFETTTKRKSTFANFSYYISSLVSFINKIFRKRKEKALTKKGKMALEQLRYLALLCEATSYRSDEEILAAESAFGQAYYEIMEISSKLHKMSKTEEDYHIKKYMQHMSKILKADE